MYIYFINTHTTSYKIFKLHLKIATTTVHQVHVFLFVHCLFVITQYSPKFTKNLMVLKKGYTCIYAYIRYDYKP